MFKSLLFFTLIIAGLFSAYFLLSGVSRFPELSSGSYEGVLHNTSSDKQSDRDILFVNVRQNKIIQFDLWYHGQLLSINAGSIRRSAGQDSVLILSENGKKRFELTGSWDPLGTLVGELEDLVKSESYDFEIRKIQIKKQLDSEVEDVSKIYNKRIEYRDLLVSSDKLQFKTDKLKSELVYLEKIVTDPEGLKASSDMRVDELKIKLEELEQELKEQRALMKRVAPTITRLKKVLPDFKLHKMNEALLDLEYEINTQKQEDPEFSSNYFSDQSKLSRYREELAKERDLVYIYEYRLKQSGGLKPLAGE